MKNILTGIASGGHHGAGYISVSLPRGIDPSSNGQMTLHSQPASRCGANAPQSCHRTPAPTSSRSGCTLPGAAPSGY